MPTPDDADFKSTDGFYVLWNVYLNDNKSLTSKEISSGKTYEFGFS